MKKVPLLIPLILLLLLVDNAGAAAFYRIINVSPINVAPNSEANFTATVKGYGPEGGYVQLIFKNVTPGLAVSYNEGFKYVLATGTRKFNCTVKAGNIPPGNYSFNMGIYAQDAKTNWITAYAMVEPLPFVETMPVVPNASIENASTNITNTTNVSAPKANATAPSPAPQKAPALGVSAAIILILFAARRRG
ncbi:MAG: hypothetical protein ACE14P_00385 [Methanotrichaceae archaeon]